MDTDVEMLSELESTGGERYRHTARASGKIELSGDQSSEEMPSHLDM